MNKRLLSILTFFIIVLSSLIFGFQFIRRHKLLTEESKNKKILIIATTGMIKDTVKNIVKDTAEVKALMGPNVDPHSYRATSQDLEYLKKADIIFYNGLHLEGKMSDILENFSKIKPVFAVSNALKEDDIMRDKEEFSTGVDPHIWFDVRLWNKVVVYINSILSKYMEDKIDILGSNTKEYLKKLDRLHEYIFLKLEELPKESRILITAHDAFGYFGKAYNVTVRGLQGISTAAEFGLKDVSNLVHFILDNKINAIFIETSVPDKPIKSVIEACQNSGHQIKLGGPIFSDAMGSEGTFEGTYVGMLTHNVNAIVDALK